MAGPNDESCTSCLWFDAMDEAGTHGLCRKKAPVVIPRVETQNMQAGNVVTKAHTSFPYVRQSDWCGEHEVDTLK